jgi:glycogen debranching enzyme
MKNPGVTDDLYHIFAPSPRIDEHTRVLKHGETFAVFDRIGDIRATGLGEEGLYHRGTRHLSRLGFTIGGRAPLLLSSTVRDDNAFLVIDMTNPDLAQDGEDALARDTLHIFRRSVLWDECCHMEFRLRSYGDRPIELPLSFSFDADFRDIFEIRGQRRNRRGELLDPAVKAGSVELGYTGLDGVKRRTLIEFDQTPDLLTDREAQFRLSLDPGEVVTLSLSVHCGGGCGGERFAQIAGTVEAGIRGAANGQARIASGNEQFNDWVKRSLADVRLMVTDTEHGAYPYAGIPWFSTPFGRDGIITALECLWLDPGLARGVLEYLAATQSDALDPARDAEPGKILHEARQGEMAALGEIPFGRYYGTVDATPLFIILAAEYYVRTEDREFIAALWPNVERALSWIDEYGDADGDGFVEYSRRSATGLATQGWKDSFDSVFHADGALAEGPVALCEVQAYVYGARRGGARLASVLGHHARAETLERQARDLKTRFEESFWSEELGTYVLALDGAKRQCHVRASNAGHCLLTGIASPERAQRVAAALLDDTSWSGWGIRTVPSTEVRFNPMAYHNGSVWPHDNALIAAGFARYGLNEPMLRIFSGMFDVSRFVELQRLPELFCGFPRRPGEGPTLYPVACAPQAWAAGSVLLLLASCTGLRIDAPSRRIELFRPALPAWLERVQIAGLRVGDASVDIELTRHPEDVGVTLVRRSGEIEVVVIK